MLIPMPCLLCHGIARAMAHRYIYRVVEQNKTKVKFYIYLPKKKAPFHCDIDNSCDSMPSSRQAAQPPGCLPRGAAARGSLPHTRRRAGWARNPRVAGLESVRAWMSPSTRADGSAMS